MHENATILKNERQESINFLTDALDTAKITKNREEIYDDVITALSFYGLVRISAFKFWQGTNNFIIFFDKDQGRIEETTLGDASLQDMFLMEFENAIIADTVTQTVVLDYL